MADFPQQFVSRSPVPSTIPSATEALAERRDDLAVTLNDLCQRGPLPAIDALG